MPMRFTSSNVNYPNCYLLLFPILQTKTWMLVKVHCLIASTPIISPPNCGVWSTTRPTKPSSGTASARSSSLTNSSLRNRSCLLVPPIRTTQTALKRPTSQVLSVSSICTASRKLMQLLKTSFTAEGTVGSIIIFTTQTSSETTLNLLRV